MADVTPPLDDFLREFEANDNLWWYTDCGHHLNLFEAAVERMQQAERALGEGVAADNLQQQLDELEREDPAVAEASAALDEVYEHLKGRLPSPQVAEIYDLERPYERTLSDGDGDLG